MKGSRRIRLLFRVGVRLPPQLVSIRKYRKSAPTDVVLLEMHSVIIGLCGRVHEVMNGLGYKAEGSPNRGMFVR